MASSSSNPVDNLAERIHKVKYKHGHDYKIFKAGGINSRIVSAVPNTKTLRMT